MARPAVEKPSTDKFFELACSPAVKIYVGPEEKLYTLPKDLLCYYSPYFVACFNGGFKEGKEGVLRLPEDEVRYFDVLMMYPRQGAATFEGAGVSDCVAFIKFCDKYDIGELASAAEVSLKNFLGGKASLPIEPDDVASLATLLHPQNPVLHVIYRAIIGELGKEGQSGRQNRPFMDLVGKDDRVALGIMRSLTLELEYKKYESARAIFV